MLTSIQPTVGRSGWISVITDGVAKIAVVVYHPGKTQQKGSIWLKKW